MGFSDGATLKSHNQNYLLHSNQSEKAVRNACRGTAMRGDFWCRSRHLPPLPVHILLMSFDEAGTQGVLTFPPIAQICDAERIVHIFERLFELFVA
jgi:hypothetical protein